MIFLFHKLITTVFLFQNAIPVVPTEATNRLLDESITVIVLVLLLAVIIYGVFKGGKAMINAIDRWRKSFEQSQKESNEAAIQLAVAITALKTVIENDIKSVEEAVIRESKEIKDNINDIHAKLNKINEKLASKQSI